MTEISTLLCHLGVVLTVVHFRADLRHFLHRPVRHGRHSGPGAWCPLPLLAGLLTLHTLLSSLSLQLFVRQIKRIFLWSFKSLIDTGSGGGGDGGAHVVDTGLGVTGRGGEEGVEEREAGD